jgi:hypothetical protein
MFIVEADVNLSFRASRFVGPDSTGVAAMNSISRSILVRSLVTGATSLAFMTMGPAVVRAQTGADGGSGADCFDDGCHAGNGGDGDSVTADGDAVAGAGGAGGIAFPATGFDGMGGNGGDAIATSTSGDATAIGGAGGLSPDEPVFGGAPGNATATSNVTANSGNVTSSATAIAGVTTPASFTGHATATSSATTAEGGLAQAYTRVQADFGESQATAKTSFGGVSVQSTVEAGANSIAAIAQGGSGQSLLTSKQFDGFAFSTALPNTAYATALIGSASNVANALLEPGETIFGTAIVGPGGSVTFDFVFRGDLIIGDVDNNSAGSLDSVGPDIDLTFGNAGVFVIGGIAAAPETSTWAMMLIGFAGLGFAGYRRGREPRAA